MSECYSFVVNGVPCSTEEEKPLLRYLRDELRLTSVKDGCSEGACGTCTILVDGKAVKACVLSTKRAAGKEIVTVEGLSEAEREAFVYAFGAVGAVQCGFCIPGMVMAGKALLDQNPNPSEAEIKKAIRGNVCRCTGYKKIIEGIALAGAILRGEASVDPALEEGEDYGVGARAFRTDVRDKVLGRGEYCDDLYLDGMAHASAVRSQYPRARVLDIDPSAALALPGVLAVLTADDVPHNKVGHLQQDWDVMIAKGDITRCVGDAICLVVAENETVLKQAKELVKVDYEPLEPVRTIQEARAADAPILHPGGNLCQQRHVTRGDARAALAQSKYVVTQSYRTPFTEHAFLEPECAVAFPYKDGVKVYTSDQGVYDTRKEISIMLGWEPECIVVENKLVGGGFGGKEDVSVQHLAVLAALRVNRPVKAKLTRQESINFHPKRHYMEGTFTWAATRTASSPAWTARSTSTLGPTPPCAGRCWSGPAPTRWAPTATRTPTSAASAGTPTTPLPAPSGASACARVSSPWSPTSTCWRKKWASPPGRSASATPSSRGRPSPTARLPTAPPPSRRPCWR
jgi:aldehyde oxidoreductase